MDINPFIICNVAEQARFRAQMNRDQWIHECLVLGVQTDTALAYDQQAGWYAMTTPYRNSDVVAYLRQIALDDLLRGEPIPETPQGAIEAENARRLDGTMSDLKKRFG